MLKKYQYTTLLLTFSICNFSFLDFTLASKSLKHNSQVNDYHDNLLQEDLFQNKNFTIAQKNLARFIEVGDLIKNQVKKENLEYFKSLIYSVSLWNPNTSLTDNQSRVIQTLYSRGIAAKYVRHSSGAILFVVSVGGYRYYCYHYNENNENKLLCRVPES